MAPAMDDIRIRRGRPVTRQVALDDVVVSGESTDDMVREDVHLLGTALQFRGRTWTGAGEAVQIAGWASRRGEDVSSAAQRSMDRSPG